jgi:hypothetical protein
MPPPSCFVLAGMRRPVRIVAYLEFVRAGSDVEDGVGRVVLKVEFGPGGRHTPGTTAPLRHLQDEEHELSGVPFKGPSSHSSSKLASQTPSPQPSGVAPFTMM